MSTASPTMNRFSELAGRRQPTQFGYEAVEDSKRRKNVSARIQSEDAVLPAKKRDKLTATTRETQRNFTLLGWMLRQHLAYVSLHDFRARTPDKGFNREFEALITDLSSPLNFHTAGRFGLTRATWMFEGHATADGDCGLLLMRDGRVQPIVSDLIRTPDKQQDQGQDPDRWTNGVKTDQSGRPTRYGIWRRTKSGKDREFARTVSARNLILHGYFDTFDQLRGISPLAPALNPLRDVNENFSYALAKAKVAQLFALIIKSNDVDQLGAVTNDGDATNPKYRVKFGTDPQKLELQPGDDAEVLESKQPSTEFLNFTRWMLDTALKALDLPFSFLDESFTTFYGSRAAEQRYLRSCIHKRQNLQAFLARWTRWRLALAIADRMDVVRGKTLAELPFQWVPRGVNWWDPAKEIRGNLAAISAGLDSPQRVTTESGNGDWYDNIDQIADALEYAREKGVPVSFDAATLADIAAGDTSNQLPDGDPS